MKATIMVTDQWATGPRLTCINIASRSFSLNSLGTETNPHHHTISMRTDNADDLVAKLQAMSVKQDRLEERNEHLTLRTQELEDIVAARDLPVRPSSNRGGVASRGSSVEQKRQASRRIAREASIPEPEEAPVELAVTDAVVRLSVYLGRKVKDLPPEVKRARSALQDEVSRNFRMVIGVPGKIYPDLSLKRFNETTGELFLSPSFEYTVTHPTNVALFVAVARQVEQQLRGGINFYPPGLSIPDASVEWDRALLIEMARTSFRSCKQQWREQMDEEVAQREELSRRTNRWRERRITKAEQLRKGVQEFTDKYNSKPDNVKAGFKLKPKDVEELIHEQLMSDEASGPEEGDTRGKAAWDTHMAFKGGLGDLTDAQMAKVHFLEVIGTPWRSDEFSTDLHELAKTAFNAFSEKEKKKIHYTRVRGTGRTSSRIPLIAPYDYSINQTWFNTYKLHPDYRHLLGDWGNFPDPQGLGTNKHTTNATEEAGGDDADVESNNGTMG
ncbi:hypothetical protein B0H19DRAFT_1077795 [Mycena capillaripes]|nr:hypothetical protein B0H19DRAFT_1077795 [Mycena capillaripes]